MSTPILGITAFSGTGKTTLLTQLIPALTERGVRVSVIKHAHHEFDVDTPGKDSYRIRKAGAEQTIVASTKRWALMTETPDSDSVDLDYLVQQLDSSKIDLVLVEGFKSLDIPKIILHRTGTEKPWPAPTPQTLAIATDDISVNIDLPLLNLNDIDSIAAFICKHFKLQLQSSLYNKH